MEPFDGQMFRSPPQKNHHHHQVMKFRCENLCFITAYIKRFLFLGFVLDCGTSSDKFKQNQMGLIPYNHKMTYLM